MLFLIFFRELCKFKTSFWLEDIISLISLANSVIFEDNSFISRLGFFLKLSKAQYTQIITLVSHTIWDSFWFLWIGQKFWKLLLIEVSLIKLLLLLLSFSWFFIFGLLGRILLSVFWIALLFDFSFGIKLFRNVKYFI